jgi:hypothetical protein
MDTPDTPDFYSSETEPHSSDMPPAPYTGKPRGRPALLPEQRRTATIGVRVTGDVAERLHALAAKHRTTISALTARFYQSILERNAG